MGQVLLDYPFLLSLAAGLVAGISAVLARRAASALGSGLRWLAGLLTACAVVAFAGSFLWSWGWTGTRSLPGIVTSIATYAVPGRAPSALALGVDAIGWLIVGAGAALVCWGLAARTRAAVYLRSAQLFNRTPPYTRLRRPIALGLMVAGLGASIVAGTASAWLCLGVWVVCLQPLLELSDWEVASRVPAQREYQRRTPRYLPFRRRLPPVSRGDTPEPS